MVGGERKYRIKKDALHKIQDEKTSGTFNQFEKHMLQECIKQVLFAQGSEEIEVAYPIEVGTEDGKYTEYRSIYQKIVPKEVIQLLLDYDMIELYDYN